MQVSRPGSVALPPRREYSEAFKRKVVSEVENGTLTREAARRKYDIGGGSTVDRWCRKYGNFERLGVRITVQSSNERDETKALKERIRKLEAALADEKLRSMAFETMIEVAERELKVPIRKKPGAKQ
jgi:transposase